MDYFSDYKRSKEYTYSYNKNWKSPEYTRYRKIVNLHGQGETQKIYYLTYIRNVSLRYEGLINDEICEDAHNVRGPAWVYLDKLSNVIAKHYCINGKKR